ncbi:hypothetical protein PCC9214_00336 [Planktothrix tepida]|uniref:hypothetical protein n=1 Tax=Planktothrix tepida TaxID=1678309 RepID=UPI0020B1D5B9|nr:hypothetical protein [Planktothrix tepida]CAD5915890.1 hypothetical protein PCC9214_00336 [Planktothrix tepida]
MNVQKEQIQALIAEIDEVLSQPNLRLPWVVFGETVTRSRQVLERVRKYLVFLQQQVDEGALLSPMETQQSESPGMREPLWQAIRREMIYLRTHLTQPLQEEVDYLRAEQRSLVQEIQQLEARKAQTLAQIQPPSYQQQLSREFLQEFMTRLQDSLIHNVTETLNHIENRFLDSVLLTESNSLPALPSNPSDGSQTSVSSLTPAQRLEQMRQLQAQSDHLLMTLDSSLSVIFEALQRNLQTYSDSLSQSLERMHSLGKQGEVMFTTLVNQLAQQVGQETSSYLQSSLQLTESESPVIGLEETKNREPEIVQSVITPPVSSDEELSFTVEEFLPYAGAEVPRQPGVGFTVSQEMAQAQEEEEKQPDTIQPLSSVEVQSPRTIEEELELRPEEPGFSLAWDESVLESESSDADLDLEALFNGAEEKESAIVNITEPEEIDLFGEDVVSLEAEKESPVVNITEPEEIDLFGEDVVSLEAEKESPIVNITEPEEIDLFGEDVVSLEAEKESPIVNITEPEEIDLFGEDAVSLEAEKEYPIVNITEPEEIDLFGEDVEILEEFDEDEEDLSEDIETLLLDEETPTEAEGLPGVNESDFNRDTEEVLEDSKTTESIQNESVLSLNSLDLFNESNLDVSQESKDLESEAIVAEFSIPVVSNPFEETLADLSDIFEEPTFEDESPVNLGVVSARTQEMLTGIPTVQKSPSRNLEKQTASLETDEYIQASPDENLLPISLEETSDQVDSRLLIGRNTLEFLEADLFNLEQVESKSEISFPTKNSSEKSLNPKLKSQTLIQKPTLEVVPKSSSPEEVITFEDLFRDIGMEPRSAQSVPALSVKPLNVPSEEAENLVSLQSFSDLTLDDVFNSLNLAEETPLRLDNEQEEENSLSLEALSQEFYQ